MNITIVHNILWSHYTGKVFSELNKLCLKNGHQLMVIQIALTMASRKNIGDIDYSVHDYPFQLLSEGTIEETTWYGRTQAIHQVIKKNHPDVLVLTGFEDPANWLMMVWAKMKGIKLAITADSTEKDRPRIKYKELFKKVLLKLPSLIMCYGEAHKQYLLLLDVPEVKIKIRIQATDNDKTRQIFNSISKVQIDFLPKNNFLFVGRLIDEKNLFRLLDAFESINTNWGLVLVGDGYLEPLLKDYVEKKCIKNVFFEGPKKLEQVIQYYKNHDVLILPSVSETWGLVVNEAMLCEMPVMVSTNCGCSLDLVSENGYVFDPLRVDDIASCMEKMIANSDKLYTMGQKSLEIISKFTPEKSAQQMLEAINSI